MASMIKKDKRLLILLTLAAIDSCMETGIETIIT